eukprot:6867656-Pyramimonas_sp.AAC.1
MAASGTQRASAYMLIRTFSFQARARLLAYCIVTDGMVALARPPGTIRCVSNRAGTYCEINMTAERARALAHFEFHVHTAASCTHTDFYIVFEHSVSTAHPHQPIQERCPGELGRSGKRGTKEGHGRTAQRSEGGQEEVDGWMDE